jgi:hypothetical protein
MLGQRGAAEPGEQTTTLHSTARLVVVPALVRDHAGQVVAGLSASSFRLPDDSVEQTLTVEPPEAESTDVVILLQTGGEAQRAFPYYRDVGPMVEPMMGKSPHRVALVTFDSKVEQIWNFPPRGEGINYAFAHPQAGDGGAALLDAIDFAVKMLDEQVASRRMIVLFSQDYDA